MKNNFLFIFSIIILVSFLNTGGCGSGGDNGSNNSSSEDTGMPDGGSENGGTEPVNLIPGGNIAQNPQTFKYVTGSSERQELDFYGIQNLPTAKEGLRPAILFIHGGGWVAGSKADVDPLVFEVAEAAGFHLISIGYRLANDESAPWPGIIEDINAAIRWVKLNSEMLGVDPDSLVLAGPSAGGHLAALAATASDVSELQGTDNPGASTNVKAVVLIFGAYNLRDVFTLQALNLIFELNCNLGEAVTGGLAISLLIDDNCNNLIDLVNPLSGCNQNTLELASPVFHVDSSDPPMLLLHGTMDCSVLFLQSQEMADTLDSAGVFNQFILTEGGEHNLASLNVTSQDFINFLETIF